MKKIVSFIICITAAAVLAVTAFAARPSLSLSSVSVPCGETEVTVALSVGDMRSLTGVRVSFTYPDNLTLISCVKTTDVEGTDMLGLPRDNGNGTVTSSYVWLDGLEDYVGSFELAYLTFVLPDGAKAGDEYGIKLTHGGDGVIDFNENTVSVTAADGKITVTDEQADTSAEDTSTEDTSDDPEAPDDPVTAGDVNGDGTVNAKDASALLKRLAGWNIKINEDAADTTADKVVNAKDAAQLMKYLAGWNVKIG